MSKLAASPQHKPASLASHSESLPSRPAAGESRDFNSKSHAQFGHRLSDAPLSLTAQTPREASDDSDAPIQCWPEWADTAMGYAGSAASGVYNAVAHPITTATNVLSAVAHPITTATNAYNYVTGGGAPAAAPVEAAPVKVPTPEELAKEAEIARLTERNLASRATATVTPPALPGGASTWSETPATPDAKYNYNSHAGSPGLVDTTDRALAERQYAAEIKNRAAAAAGAKASSGEWAVEKLADGSLGPKTFSGEIHGANGAVIKQADPAKPGKLDKSRQDLLKSQIIASGKATDDSAAPLPKVLGIDPALKNGKSAVDLATDKPYQDALNDLGKKRGGGANAAVQGTHLNHILDKNSDQLDPATGAVTTAGPLGHSHTAHGNQIPVAQQLERVVYGIRPDERTTNPGLHATPTGATLPAVAINPGLTPGSNPAELQENARRNALVGALPNTITQFPQAPGKSAGAGMASQFADPVAEYQAINLNMAEAWQQDSKKDYAAVNNPTTGVPFTEPQANRIAFTNKISNTKVPNGKNPLPYGHGFAIGNVASGATNINRNAADRDAKATARSGQATIAMQDGVKTVIEKQMIQSATGKTKSFNVVTNFPAGDAEGASIRTGNTDTAIGGLHEAPYNSLPDTDPLAKPAPSDEEQLAASLLRIPNTPATP